MHPARSSAICAASLLLCSLWLSFPDSPPTSCGLCCCVLRPHLASDSACGTPFSIVLHQFSLVWQRTIFRFPPKRPLLVGLTLAQILTWLYICCVVWREASGPQFLGWHRKDHWPKGHPSMQHGSISSASWLWPPEFLFHLIWRLREDMSFSPSLLLPIPLFPFCSSPGYLDRCSLPEFLCCVTTGKLYLHYQIMT